MWLQLLLILLSGVIKHGGVKPNIIPSYTELEFYLRAPSRKDLVDLEEKANACFKAAAAATGCKVSLGVHSWYDNREIGSKIILLNSF